MTRKYKINGKEYDVEVNSVRDSLAEVTVNGILYQVELETDASPEQPQVLVSKSSRVSRAGETEIKVTSPLPGVVTAVKVQTGDVVKQGQVLVVLEAMKMENEIQSEYDGVVSAVRISKDDSVLEGDVLVILSIN